MKLENLGTGKAKHVIGLACSPGFGGTGCLSEVAAVVPGVRRREAVLNFFSLARHLRFVPLRALAGLGAFCLPPQEHVADLREALAGQLGKLRGRIVSENLRLQCTVNLRRLKHRSATRKPSL